MKFRTQAVVFGVLALTAAATILVASQGSASNVRTVEELEAAPGRHRGGSYVLMAVPEPAKVPLTGAEGVYLAPNVNAPTSLSWTHPWQDAMGTYYSTQTLGMTSDGHEVRWVLRNETRANPASPVVASREQNGSFPWSGELFVVRGFDDGDQHTPMLWALLPKAPTEPLQPKPSQLTGHLLSMLPDGTVLPPSVMVYDVTQLTVGCSSKFLPPQEQERTGNATAAQ